MLGMISAGSDEWNCDDGSSKRESHGWVCYGKRERSAAGQLSIGRVVLYTIFSHRTAAP